MHIALNLMYVGGGVAGGRVYAQGLLRGLSELSASGLHFTCFMRRGVALPNLPPEQIKQVVAPVAVDSVIGRTWWEYRQLPKLVREGHFTLLHGLGSLSPSAAPVPLVLTVHDLIHLRYAQSNPISYRLFIKYMGPLAAHRACRIIVPSRFTGDEVMERYRIPGERIRVIPNGAGDLLTSELEPGAVASVRNRLALRGPYLLSVARGYPHKNLMGLLRAFARLTEKHGNLRLVLVGEKHLTGSELGKACAELHLQGKLVLTGFVDVATLNALYVGATAFVFSSLAEGFGMPPLEAMTCGTPVIASDATAIPEVVGDAGLLVDASSPEALADAIHRVLDDESLQMSLRQKGLARAREFTWKRCAAATVAVYREVAEEAKR